MVPRNPTGYGLADMDTSWSTPTLRDFTTSSWAALSALKQKQIARHFTYAPTMPPDTFSSLSLPHHRADGADVVWRGVVAAAGRLDQTNLPANEMGKVRAHLAAHYAQFGRVAPWKRSADRWDHFIAARDRLGHPWRDADLADVFREQGFPMEATTLGDFVMDDQREVRTVSHRVELRSDTDKPPTLEGYAAVFDAPTTIGGPHPFQEVVDRHAFDGVLNDDVRVLFNHDPNKLLGRTKSGTASIAIDNHGLRYQVTPPNTPTGNEVLALVERGDVDGSSFGFRVLEDTWTEGVTADDLPLRRIQKVALYDVSPVTQPAYPTSSVEARNWLEAKNLEQAVQARKDLKRDALAETESRRMVSARNIADMY